MKKFFTILIYGFSFLSFSQTELKLYSLDKCSNEIGKLNFELADSNFNLYPSIDSLDVKEYQEFFSKPIFLPKGTYYVFYSFEIEDTDYFHISNSLKIDILDSEIYSDTIVMPKIRLGYSMALHSNERYYFNCNKICNGIEIEYFDNGNKKLQGNFDNGIPLKIKHYYENGNIKMIELFQNGSFEPYKIERYDIENNLLEYELRIIRNKKTIIKKYNKNNKLIDKEILDYIIN
ncbi:toxin-antitoxin system YwqK family antitoxin [Winogradskyella algicola]|uniref:hypothetical protein n=1 Tax=Winogradskyella algicola TaxID=2575815 RepID=UPI001108E853|nr:hypothetical protein [Winogradskyella algicola]